jgi:hypothetical protein
MYIESFVNYRRFEAIQPRICLTAGNYYLRCVLVHVSYIRLAIILGRNYSIHRETPVSTIRYTIKKEVSRIHKQSSPRPGVPRKLSEEQRDHLYALAVNKNFTSRCVSL